MRAPNASSSQHALPDLRNAGASTHRTRGADDDGTQFTISPSCPTAHVAPTSRQRRRDDSTSRDLRMQRLRFLAVELTHDCLADELHQPGNVGRVSTLSTHHDRTGSSAPAHRFPAGRPVMPLSLLGSMVAVVLSAV